MAVIAISAVFAALLLLGWLLMRRLDRWLLSHRSTEEICRREDYSESRTVYVDEKGKK